MALALGFSQARAATLLTTEVGYTGPALILSPFASFPIGSALNYTFGPTAIPGGLTFTSDEFGGSVVNGSVLGRARYDPWRLRECAQ